jgi:hypothetical protein
MGMEAATWFSSFGKNGMIPVMADGEILGMERNR